MKNLFENFRSFMNEGVMDDKPYLSDKKAKAKFNSNNIYTEEEAEQPKSDEIEDTVIDVLKDEGGAAGLEPIKKAAEDLDLPDGFDLKDFLKGLRDVGQHEDGDYILDDSEEIDVKEGVEIFLEAQEEMLDEKRKRKKKCLLPQS